MIHWDWILTAMVAALALVGLYALAVKTIWLLLWLRGIPERRAYAKFLAEREAKLQAEYRKWK